MKYNKYLIISIPILIILITALFYTKNIIYFYLTIPVCIYISFIRYFQEKSKLLVKTNKILKLLKYEWTINTAIALIVYLTSSFSYTNHIKIAEYFYFVYIITLILLLLYAVIYIKRTLLIRQELRKNNSK